MTDATQPARHSELVVVMVKHPAPGRVKTRLAAGVGEGRAVEIYRELVTLTLKAVGAWLGAAEGAATDRTVWICFDPADEEMAVREWLGPAVAVWGALPGWVAQSEGDLGMRLQSVFHQSFICGFSAVCVIGTDCPHLTADDLGRAFQAVAQNSVVLGPAADGGYYLICLKNEHKALFHNIPWSSETTYRATCEAAHGLGLHVCSLRPLEDVDTAAEWRRWKKLDGI